MQPIGYIKDQTILCDCCADDGDSPIWSTTEVDAPWHCAECGAVIPCTLTAEGERYVRERVTQYLTSRTGDAHVLEDWCQDLLGTKVNLTTLAHFWNLPRDEGLSGRVRQAHNYLFHIDRMSDEPVAAQVERLEAQVNEDLPTGLRLVDGKLEVFL